MSKDPVCGMTVDPASAAGHVDDQGKTYHFCSQHCVHAFKADPQKFLGKKPAPEPAHFPVQATASTMRRRSRAMSSVSVVTNARRLRASSFRIRAWKPSS